jgi:4-diphosphocytidyl-2-C-methyl-D-erythritol kinase
MITLPSFAKINWLLRVRGKRADGYHELCTVFQTVTLHDTLTFESAGDRTLECDDPSVPTDGRNLVLKAAAALGERFGVSAGFRIRLEKRVPAPGGLGGGSSNAAMALLGLSELWRLDPKPSELLDIAGELGSDVPFFLTGGTALGTGRGEVVEPVGEVDEAFLVIVRPPVEVPTGQAFASLGAKNLTDIDSESTLSFCRREAQNLQIQQGQLVNDFEGAVFAREPEVAEVRDALLESGARAAQLSGSGASVFAVFDKEETRQATLEAFRNRNWRMFAAATISRSDYREALGQCRRLLPISF